MSGLAKPFKLKMQPRNSVHTWKTQIVASELPETQLPKSMKHSYKQVKMVCLVEASLNGVDMKMKNRHWYSRGKKHLLAEFIVNAVIGHADLTFQIHDKAGRKLNQVDDPISVTWNPPQRRSFGEDQETVAEERYELG